LIVSAVCASFSAFTQGFSFIEFVALLAITFYLFCYMILKARRGFNTYMQSFKSFPYKSVPDSP
jgi:hypothetical protein